MTYIVPLLGGFSGIAAEEEFRDNTVPFSASVEVLLHITLHKIKRITLCILQMLLESLVSKAIL